MPHTNNGGPGDFKLVLLEPARHFAGGLADDFDTANDRVLVQLACVEPDLIQVGDELYRVTSRL